MTATEPPIFNPPADRDISIWRYMNLSKFAWMLQNKALYFCRCDRLGDPYEGYHTQPVATNEAEYTQTLLANAQFFGLSNAEEIAKVGFKHLLNVPKQIRAEMFVSCWHMNDEESSAMWKLYTSHDESICLRSTYETLAQALPNACTLGCVKYIDYRKDTFDIGNQLNYIFHKRKSFEHEREARAVVWKPRNTPAVTPIRTTVDSEGLIVPVNICDLVKEIFVSPESKTILREIVDGLAKKYGLSVTVRQSTANDPPPY
jgi:hypothetical protein